MRITKLVRKLALFGILPLLFIIVVFISVFETVHSQCDICYIQKYERSMFSITMPFASEYEYNEIVHCLDQEISTDDHIHKFRVIEHCSIIFGCIAVSTLRTPNDMCAD